MKIEVIVRPNSRIELVEVLEENKSFRIKVNAPPEDGKANKKVIELLSDFLKVPKSKIELVSGFKSKKKIFKVSE
jgi:uncharacterized protein